MTTKSRKLRSSSARDRSRSDERGVALVLVTILLACILGLAALAMDVAKLYKTRLDMERSLRLAVAGVLGKRALIPWETIHGGPLYDVGTGNPIAPSNVLITELKATMRQIATENMQAAGSPLSAGNHNWVTVDYDHYKDTAQMSLRYQMPMFLMDKIPFFNPCGGLDTCTVTAFASATLKPANIALVLDSSGSMACEAFPFGACTCRNPLVACSGNNTNPPAPQLPQKIAFLKDAVRTFVTFFNPLTTRITLVPFNLVAADRYSASATESIAVGANSITIPIGRTVAGSYRAIPFGYDANRFRRLREAITQMNPRSNTNPCDGMVTAIDDMLNVSELAEGSTAIAAAPVVTKTRNIFGRPTVDTKKAGRRGDTFFVLFTDGAPTAGRYRFEDQNANKLTQATQEDDTTPAANPRDPLSRNNNVNDWILYTVDYKDNSAGNVVGIGPSLLVHKTSPGLTGANLLYEYTIGSGCTGAPSCNNCPAFPDRATRCPTPASLGAQFCTSNELYSHLFANGAAPALVGCLNSMRFSLPITANTGPTYGAVNPASRQVGAQVANNSARMRDFQQQHYHCLIEAADYARMEGARVFSIGLGQPLPPAPNQGAIPRTDDPYEDVEKPDNFKPKFLSRVALAKGLNVDDFLGPANIAALNHPGHSLNTQAYRYGYDVLPVGNPLITTQRGLSVATSDARRLNNLFGQIAKEILLALQD